MVEADLERAEERAEAGENKIVELEEELRVVGNNLKSLELSEEKALEKEDVFAEQIRQLDFRLKEVRPPSYSDDKIVELEEELRVVGNNLKSLEVSEEKALQREDSYEEQIRTISARLKEAETRAEFAERSVQKLQKEVDRLEEEKDEADRKNRQLQEELDHLLTELNGV
ncbi:Tropomyosin [Dictyocaulus viviparus]|uniref:Tropomyosin n=1 Tax=Dictyocaulus viviparus TaxID=29172 RepID=A0A0D8XBJ2_DICVI|nr:Tropomyosin [Dictyocaulus viviparus]